MKYHVLCFDYCGECISTIFKILRSCDLLVQVTYYNLIFIFSIYYMMQVIVLNGTNSTYLFQLLKSSVCVEIGKKLLATA